MKVLAFNSAIEAIFWWHTLKEIGLQVRYVRSDFGECIVQVSRRTPVPSDTWCVWVMLDILIDRLPRRYHRVIEEYFIKGRYIKPFRRWRFSGRWRACCRLLWAMMPDEMKI